MCIELHAKCPLFLSDFNETWFFSTDFRKKYPTTKLHENPSSGSRVSPCGRTDMTKLIATFRNFAKAPKNAQNPEFMFHNEVCIEALIQKEKFA